MPYYSSTGAPLLWPTTATSSTTSATTTWYYTPSLTTANPYLYFYSSQPLQWPHLFNSAPLQQPQQWQQAALQQQWAALQQNRYAQQQNRYQPMGQPLRQPQQLAAPAIIRRPQIHGESDEAYEARRAALQQQWATQEEAYAAQRRVAEEAAQRRRAADQRALELLREHLSAAQLAQLAAEGYFIVIGQSGRRYRLHANRGVAANIEVFHANDNRIIHRLCCHLDTRIPTADHFLAQKIMLESAEEDFLRVANRHGIGLAAL